MNRYLALTSFMAMAMLAAAAYTLEQASQAETPAQTQARINTAAEHYREARNQARIANSEALTHTVMADYLQARASTAPTLSDTLVYRTEALGERLSAYTQHARRTYHEIIQNKHKKVLEQTLVITLHQ